VHVGAGDTEMVFDGYERAEWVDQNTMILALSD
jgi:hypothetical protein